MVIELITQADLDELAKQMEAKVLRALEMEQDEGGIVYDNDSFAKKMNVSKRTLQSWRDGGLIEFSQIGHKIYYTEKALAKLLENKKVKFWGK